MSSVQVRPPMASDLPTLMVIDHTCTADSVWQMEFQCQGGKIDVGFREVRLPRQCTVAYPRLISRSVEDWRKQEGMLVALVDNHVAGYARMNDRMMHAAVWVTDLAVAPRFRGQGAAVALIQAAQSWGLDHGCNRIMMEMSSKNQAAICLVQKLGFEFCGYNDRYYFNQDIALFFGRKV